MTIHLREHGPARVVPRLPDEVAAALAPLVRVSSHGRDSTVRQAGKVGLVRAGGLTVYVEPKIPLPQLMLLLDYKKQQVEWQEPAGEAQEAGDLAAAVGDVYCRLAERALTRGVLHGYRPTAASSSVLRGRVRMADQVVAHHGAAYPFEVTYPRYGPDVPENRVLKAATLEVSRQPRLRPQTRVRLHGLLRRLEDVGTPARTDSWRASRLNAHYGDALRLADVILRGSAFSPQPGAVPVSGFVLSMDVVFEQFVCAALDEAMRARAHGHSKAPYHSHADTGGLVPIKPDYAFVTGGRAVAIADAKYKVGFDSKREDVYQMAVYCLALGVPRGHLVYAQSDRRRLVHEIRNAGPHVVKHALDLTEPRDELLAAVGRVADELVVDIPETSTPPNRGGRA